MNCKGLSQVLAMFYSTKLQHATAKSSQQCKKLPIILSLWFLNVIWQFRNFGNKQLGTTLHFLHVGERLEVELEQRFVLRLIPPVIGDFSS